MTRYAQIVNLDAYSQLQSALEEFEIHQMVNVPPLYDIDAHARYRTSMQALTEMKRIMQVLIDAALKED